MSIFSEVLPKINEISNAYVKEFEYNLKAIHEAFENLEKQHTSNGRGRARDKALKDKNLTLLQSINEDEDNSKEVPSNKKTSNNSNPDTISQSSLESDSDKGLRGSKKRSKNEVDGIFSPEQDKRQKRTASVRAQSNISKQVNVNLTQKLRREASIDKNQGKSRTKKDDDKENTEPVLATQIKQEKISMPTEEVMDMGMVPIDVAVKQEKDEIAMPPPAAPVPKPRKNLAKEKEALSDEESSGRRRTKNKKQTDQPAVAPPSTRASSRATRQLDNDEKPPPPDTRPKRTRGRKKATEVTSSEVDTQSCEESVPSSPADKPRPKRTRRGKAAEKEQKQIEKESLVSPEETPLVSSPILQTIDKSKMNLTEDTTRSKVDKGNAKTDNKCVDETDKNASIQFDETRIIDNNSTVVLEMDKTVTMPNGVNMMNETVVLSTHSRETMVIEKQRVIMDTTVVLNKEAEEPHMTDDNSIMTDDDDDADPAGTPARNPPPTVQPTSAVKEKVQQFEEMASRVTRTKTRAMAKKEEETENQTPPDKISKPILSIETLTKMNNMIFNGKPPMISTSASKPRAIPILKSQIPASTSKLSALSKAKEAAEESLKMEKEDARKKKEAMLEAKREQQKRKREEKMAAAAAAREAAEKERKAALEAAARDRILKQAHADRDKVHRLKEVEKKKQELARKVAETEERRKAEEQARRLRLAEEQRRADLARRKQLDEAHAMKKEAIMAKEIEKKQKEYIEKQKLRHRMENDKSHTPMQMPEPVYMADGFQYLNSDEEAEPVERPIPAWSTSKARRQWLVRQSAVATAHVDRLFSVRVHCPDLRDIFPGIERARLKRTSSAVWRTPTRLPALLE
ncbi:hypothetical protein ACJJTC_004205 [Scirpophaga incertulas]